MPSLAMARRLYLIAILALASMGIAAPAEARSISAGACSINHVKLVDANAYVVVAEIPQDSPGFRNFYPGDRVMCDVGVGVWRRLARTGIEAQYETLRISGHFVGFSGRVYSCENCNGDDSFVGVKNAASGHTMFMRFMHLTEKFDTTGYEVPDMVLKPNGSVAFTIDGKWRHGWKRSHMVIKHDLCGGTRILDSSRRYVRVHSLKRRGPELRWRHGRRLKTAELC